MTIAVIAEKPAMARDIAQVLGATKRHGSTLEGNGYLVTWAIGHLVGLAEPEQMEPAWKAWRAETLPMLPREWPLTVLEQTRDQFEVVRVALNRRDVERIVCATDAGREGELIFRRIYRQAGCTRPVDRLWISSLTPAAIAEGFRRLRPATEFDDLGDAAEGRARADWLVGLNLTRAYSLRFGPELLSVGRVQTPTLAMLVEREQAIREFVPEHYCLVVATFEELPGRGFAATWFDPVRVEQQREHAAVRRSGGGREGRGSGEEELEESPPAERLPADGVLAEQICARCRGRTGLITELTGRERSFPPPLLYDLTELQRHANRLFGFTAKTTLALAQALYEQHKLITYPRTDSRHLTTDVASHLPAILQTITPRYGAAVAPGTGQQPLSSRFVDDRKVTDHHAIIPTGAPVNPRSLGRDEERLFDLICRRLLMAWHRDHRIKVTEVTVTVDSAQARDQFRTRGTVVLEQGWKVLEQSAPGRTGTAEGTPIRDRSRPAPVGEPGTREKQLPEGLAVGQPWPATALEIRHQETRPPRPFTDATLLTAMETAGKTLDDRELQEAMRERGLGTPATRAAILETLIGRSYVERQGKALRATAKGETLIRVVHERVKSPGLTGEWELALRRMEQGAEALPAFMARIERFVQEIIGELLGRSGEIDSDTLRPNTDEPRGGRAANWSAEADPQLGTPTPWPEEEYWPASPTEEFRGATPVEQPPDRPRGQPPDPDPPPRPTLPRPRPMPPPPPPRPAAPHPVPAAPRPMPAAPSPGTHAAGAVVDGGTPGASDRPAIPTDLTTLLRERFRMDRFRPHQEEVCQAVAAGGDALLVMPTGSGKSLCYQLPGIARGGTTLVISPLIALMEDQTAKLRGMGFAAERIHSGRSREELRAACKLYLAGRLDFLAIAPERLAVPGFPEMLARRPPILIAIDEAHCISHWGHDFRPDYRLLNERLPLLRAVPRVALTATATVRVQQDILEQLGMPGAHRFIRGFRRDNLAIEVKECRPGLRIEEAAALLADPALRPAIVYAPTRKAVQDVTAELGRRFPTAPYHAGMDAASRSRSQDAFQAGQVEVVVATIAFGMGIDKANIRSVLHLSLPGSVEAYYQEIGRAGRDGLPARAILLYSFVDRKIHESFFERDYPEASLLATLRDQLPRTGIPREQWLNECGLPPEQAEAALNKLWLHGGVLVDAWEDRLMPGATEWMASYLAIRAHRQGQLDEVLDFARSHECRMVRLIRHFGDTRDAHPCGICDACNPGDCRGRRFRRPLPRERAEFQAILQALRGQHGMSTGRLYQALHPDGRPERACFERWLEALQRAGGLQLQEDVFEKEGRQIRFRRALLTAEGWQASAPLLDEVLLDDEAEVVATPSRARKSSGKAGPDQRAKSRPARHPDGTVTPAAAAKQARTHPPASESPPGVPGSDGDETLFEALRAWRLELSRSKRIPAFRILSDRTLRALAEHRPGDTEELLEVPGIGPKLAEKYGTKLLEIINPR